MSALINVTELAEIGIYALTVLVGIATGVASAAPAGSQYGRARELATVCVTIVVVAAAVVLFGDAPWMGPVFACAIGFTATLAAAVLQRNRPSLRGESYWRRVMLLMLHRRRLADVDAASDEA